MATKTTKTTNNQSTTTETTMGKGNPANATGNSKYMLNGVKHGYNYCVMDITCGFIVAYATTEEQANNVLALYNRTELKVVNTKENERVQAKISAKEAILRAKLEAKLAALNA